MEDSLLYIEKQLICISARSDNDRKRVTLKAMQIGFRRIKLFAIYDQLDDSNPERIFLAVIPETLIPWDDLQSLKYLSLILFSVWDEEFADWIECY